MDDICSELLTEYRELAALCETLTADEWRLRTDFHAWTPWDEIAHLCYFDETALQSARDAAGFARDAAALEARLARGEEISGVTREFYGALDGPSLLRLWRGRFEALLGELARLEPRARLTWYGPSMSARSFATARLMETWAHGQDIWDVLHRMRLPSTRLKHIAHLGVSTFGWTFVNRGLPVPASPPFVELSAPDGSTLTWNEPSDTAFVRGPAEDFCLLVTQRRNLADTQLVYAGEAASRWLPIAQCFAGPPADAPEAGLRSAPM